MRQILLPVDPAPAPATWAVARLARRAGLRAAAAPAGARRRARLAQPYRRRRARSEERRAVPAFRGVPTFRTESRCPPRPARPRRRAARRGCAGPMAARLPRPVTGAACRAAGLARDRWPLMPTLGLLHPLADGLATADEAGQRRSWRWGRTGRCGWPPARSTSVHVDAVRRLRQAGWDAVPSAESRRSWTGPASGGRAGAALPRLRGRA